MGGTARSSRTYLGPPGRASLLTLSIPHSPAHPPTHLPLARRRNRVPAPAPEVKGEGGRPPELFHRRGRRRARPCRPRALPPPSPQGPLARKAPIT